MGYLGIYEFGLTRPYFKDRLGWHWCKCTRKFPDQGVDQVSGNRGRDGWGGWEVQDAFMENSLEGWVLRYYSMEFLIFMGMVSTSKRSVIFTMTSRRINSA